MASGSQLGKFYTVSYRETYHGFRHSSKGWVLLLRIKTTIMKSQPFRKEKTWVLAHDGSKYFYFHRERNGFKKDEYFKIKTKENLLAMWLRSWTCVPEGATISMFVGNHTWVPWRVNCLCKTRVVWMQQTHVYRQRNYSLLYFPGHR